MKNTRAGWWLFCFNALFASALCGADGQLGPDVPQGFVVRPELKVTLAADGLEEARFLVADVQGRVYVSQPTQGKILVLDKPDANGKFTDIHTLIEDYPQVHGMQMVGDTLWFTQTGSIHKLQISADGKPGPVQHVIPEGQLPRAGTHWWRSILITADAIYTGIGDSGNINDERNTDRQKIWKFKLDGTGKALYCSGLRNTEKLQIRPDTDEIWGCDHGSDFYGKLVGEKGRNQPFTDLNPTDELNQYRQGGFYGHPFIVGNLPRLEFMNKPDIDLVDMATKATPPAWQLGAHVATNGFTFLQKDSILGNRGDVLVAMHGSWNSSVRVGYAVQRVMFDPMTRKPYGAWPLVTTIDAKSKVLARPVDLLEMPDGSVLFSDDFDNKIYRIAGTPK